MQLTYDVAAEKGVDPAHNQRIWDNHGHVVLHHPHHPLHLARIRYWVRRRLAHLLGLLQKGAVLVARDEGLAPVLKRLFGEDVVVGSQGHAAAEGALLAHAPDVELLDGGGHEDGGVVAQDAGEDHDDGDGDEDPVAADIIISVLLLHHAPAKARCLSVREGGRTITGDPFGGFARVTEPF